MKPRHHFAGVTLIELMIVVVIISILGLIAFPSYRLFMQRSQRTEATEALQRLAKNQEGYYIQHNTYTTDVSKLGFDVGGLTSGGRYVIAVTSADQQGFTATATPDSGSGMVEDTDCQEFSINQSGDQTASPDPQNRCW